MMCLAFCNHSIVIIIETEKYMETAQQSPVSTMADASESPFLMRRRNILHAFKGAGCRKTQNPVRQTGLNHSFTTPCVALGQVTLLPWASISPSAKAGCDPSWGCQEAQKQHAGRAWSNDDHELSKRASSPSSPPPPPLLRHSHSPEGRVSLSLPPCSRERKPVGRASGLRMAGSESLSLPAWSSVSL